MHFMKQIITFLKQLDLSNTEIKIYLKLLSSRPLTVSELADKIKMNRTATYTHIHTLLNKGLIRQIKGSNIRIEANTPDTLYNLVDQRINQTNYLKSALPNIVNTLNANIPSPQSNSKSEMKYYKGKLGVRTIYDECLKSDEVRSYFNAEDMHKILPENTNCFNNALKNNPKMKIYEFCEDSPYARTQLMQKIIITKNYFLTSDVHLTSNDILIYDKKVAIINAKSNHELEGVIISNQDYYDNSVQLFDLLWRLLPDIDHKTL